MKRNFIKALETLTSRFEWTESQTGCKDSTKKQNDAILLALNNYYETIEKREEEMFAIYTKLLIQFRKRGYFIQCHGYSDYVLGWIHEANEDFLESEVEYRKQNGRPLVPSSLLSWIDLEANQRIVIRKAEADIEEFRKFKDNHQKQETVKKAYPHVNFTGSEPNKTQLIKFHSFKYEYN